MRRKSRQGNTPFEALGGSARIYSCTPARGFNFMKRKNNRKPEHWGYVYYLNVYGEPGKKNCIKIGTTLNPVMRLAQHQYKTFKGQIMVPMRVIRTPSYLHCEAELKQQFGGKETFPLTQENVDLVDEILNNHAIVELDTYTVGTLVEVEALKQYFNGKD